MQRLMGKFRKSSTVLSAPRASGPAEVQRLRNALLEAVSDCRDVLALRLQAQIVRAPTTQELWHLRATAHDLIARHHCQTVAAERIRRLEPLRQGGNL
jgi:hypothetical protein